MAPFEVRWSAEERAIIVLMNGFWSDENVASFNAALTGAMRRAGDRPFDLIADLSGLMAQSSAVVVLQGGVIARLIAAGLRHLVIVGAAPLLTMQVKRAAAPLMPYFYATLADAQLGIDAHQTSSTAP